MTKQELKAAVCRKIDDNREKLIQWANVLLRMPEQGFREFRTAAFVRQCMEELGCRNIRTELAETGVYGYLPTGTEEDAGTPWENPSAGEENGSLVLMGELDAIYCPEHPFADSKTHVAHACGHYTQLISVLGAALGLSGYIRELGTGIGLMAVPCEEGIEPEYRKVLLEEKGFTFCSGKQEFIRRGYMKGTGAVLMMHTAPVEELSIGIPVTSRSFRQLEITILGREAHAGGESHLGINALQCLNLILNGINGSREAFPPQDMATVNAVVREGGVSIGTIPGRAVLELQIRAVDTQAVERMAKRLIRIVKGCVYACGAQVSIQQTPGYLSIHDPGYLTEVMKQNAEELIGREKVEIMDQAPNIMTDTGDLSCLVPALQVCIGGGFYGMHHRRDFLVKNEEIAYVLPAKLLAVNAVELLWNHGRELKKVRDSFEPIFDKESYMQYWNSIS